MTDGSVLSVGNVGSVIEAPAATTARSTDRPGSSDDGRTNVLEVAPRETLWSIAAERLGSPRRWKELADLNYGIEQRDGGSLGRDHWIRPGWRLELPVGVRPRPAERSSAPNGSATNGFRSPTALHRSDHAEAAGEGRHPEPLAPAPPNMPVGAGILGVGVANLLDRMRRVQQRHRRDGTFIPLPDREQRVFEQRLRAGDGASVVEDVERALRSLCHWWERSGRRPPAILGVEVHPAAVEVFVDGVAEFQRLPGHMEIGTGGRSFTVPRPVPPTLPWPDAVAGAAAVPARRRTDAGGAPAPTLVTAGRGDDGFVMVNLEAMGSLAAAGRPDMCDGFVRALALELATSRWAGQFDLVLVGFGAELARFERVNFHTNLDVVMSGLCSRRARDRERLETSGFDSFYRARCAEGSREWEPQVVLCGPTVDERDAADLVETIADPATGTAVVACGDRIGAAHRVDLPEQGMASLAVLGTAVRPQRVGAGDVSATSALFDVATQRTSVLSSDEPYVSLPIELPVTDDTSRSAGTGGGTARSLPPAESRVAPIGGWRESPRPVASRIEVAVLGPIEIRGAAREFTRAWAKELVVYLALHPGGVTNESWATALWPDRVMAPSSLHSTASVARRSLGQSPDGTDHLPRSHGRLALADSVSTDWDRFVELARSPDLALRQEAVDLIRGRPFDGLRSTDWPILEGIGPAIEAAAVDVTGQLAGAYLADNRPDDAQRAARRGLLVSPYDERLYRMLMRAADAAGHPAGVEAVMDELVRLVADDIEPMDSIHPATIHLYRSLSRRKGQRGRATR